jgi:hypothetical protein
MIGMWMCGTGGVIYRQRKTERLEKPFPVAVCPPPIAYGLTYDRIQPSAAEIKLHYRVHKYSVLPHREHGVHPLKNSRWILYRERNTAYCENGTERIVAPWWQNESKLVVRTLTAVLSRVTSEAWLISIRYLIKYYLYKLDVSIYFILSWFHFLNKTIVGLKTGKPRISPTCRRWRRRNTGNRAWCILLLSLLYKLNIIICSGISRCNVSLRRTVCNTNNDEVWRLRLKLDTGTV